MKYVVLATKITATLLFVLQVSLASNDQFDAGYNYEEEMLYDTFPDNFMWGTATAAYQVRRSTRMRVLTLAYLIIVQDVINVQVRKFQAINKRAGCNKAVQVGIFQELIVKKPCRLEKFLKLIKRAACLLDRLE